MKVGPDKQGDLEVNKIDENTHDKKENHVAAAVDTEQSESTRCRSTSTSANESMSSKLRVLARKSSVAIVTHGKEALDNGAGWTLKPFTEVFRYIENAKFCDDDSWKHSRELLPKIYETKRWKEYVYIVPGFNVIFDIMGGDMNTFETAKGLVETNGVVAALILAIAVAIPFSVTYEDWNVIEEIFDDPAGIYYDCSFSRNFLAERFVEERNKAVLYSLLALLVMIITTVQCYVSELDDDWEILDNWWRWTRYVIFSTFILEILGILAIVNCFSYHTIMTVPNPYVFTHGCTSFDETIDYSSYYSIAFTKDSDRANNTWANTCLYAYVLTLPMPGCVLLMWSLWLINTAKLKIEVDRKGFKDKCLRKLQKQNNDKKDIDADINAG